MNALAALLRCLFWLVAIVVVVTLAVTVGMALEGSDALRHRHGFFWQLNHKILKRLGSDILVIRAKIDLWLARRIRD